MLDDLAAAVKGLGEEDLGACTGEELGELAVELDGLRRRVEAQQARVAEAFERSGAWRDDGARSAVAWLAHRTRAPKGECGARLQAGRARRVMARVVAAWEAGEVDRAHVGRLCRARNERTAADFARDEAMLVGFARSLSYADFDRAVTYWEQHADPDGADEEEMRRRERRRLDLGRTIDGMVAGSFLLDAVSGEIVTVELARLEQALFEADWAAAKERLGRDPQSWELERTPTQRRVDALVEMARRSATMPKGGKAPRPLFTVVLGAEPFQRLCQLASGQVVASAALTPFLDDAELERVLFDGSPSRPVSVSYKRAFTGALRRLIEVRDLRCYVEGCDEPVERCQVDHVQPWAQGGITAHWNGRLACGFHNRQRNGDRGSPRDGRSGDDEEDPPAGG